MGLPLNIVKPGRYVERELLQMFSDRPDKTHVLPLDGWQPQQKQEVWMMLLRKDLLRLIDVGFANGPRGQVIPSRSVMITKAGEDRLAALKLIMDTGGSA